MKLTGKVIKVESGSEFTDKQERIYVKLIEGGDSLYNTFRVPNFGYKLNDEVSVQVELVELDELKEIARAAS
jgi:hypothetical protein